VRTSLDLLHFFPSPEPDPPRSSARTTAAASRNFRLQFTDNIYSVYIHVHDIYIYI
jgi:hypothetical protein